MAHPLGILGLVLNTAGALLPLWFPPIFDGYTAEGTRVTGGWLQQPSSETQRQEWRHLYARRLRKYRSGLVLLLFGFGLQLADLLLS